MACLSISEGDIFVVCANPIFPISDLDWQEGATLTFEVLEGDASVLAKQLGKVREYSLGQQPFRGQLESLERCESTHPGLARMCDTPTLRGVLTIKNFPQPFGGKN
jgi:hypothetical protein